LDLVGGKNVKIKPVSNENVIGGSQWKMWGRKVRQIIQRLNTKYETEHPERWEFADCPRFFWSKAIRLNFLLIYGLETAPSIISEAGKGAHTSPRWPFI